MPRPQSRETISRRMATVKSRNTGPERTVRSMVHALGIRFRLANRELPGSPDLANRSKGWAIFVHGCFWHSHQGCSRATQPKSNQRYWRKKFGTNRARDLASTKRLRQCGFRVLVLWECQLHASDRLKKKLRAFLVSRSVGRISNGEHPEIAGEQVRGRKIEVP